MKLPPLIRIRGFRAVIPSGYVVGRLDPGVGDAQLVHVSRLSDAAAKSGIVQRVGGIDQSCIGFHLDGLFDGGTYFQGAISAENVTYPSSLLLSAAICSSAPFDAFTCYLVNDLAAFQSGGPPSGAIAHIDFAAGATTGTVTWYSASVAIPAFTRLYVAIYQADFTIAGITLLFSGDIA